MYLWMGLQTCAASSTNSLHTVHPEPKFVGFLHERKRNCVPRRCVPQNKELTPKGEDVKLITRGKYVPGTIR